MRLADLKRPRFYLPAALVLLLGAASAVVFHPAFQKKMLLDHVGPLVDSLDIGYLHLTPWSLELTDVSVGYRGGRFSVGKGTLRYCLSSLLLLNVNIKTLALKDVSIDLEKFRPPETAKTPDGAPFPGVLASLRHGLVTPKGRDDRCSSPPQAVADCQDLRRQYQPKERHHHGRIALQYRQQG
jgi:hypothetical protein